MWSMYFYDMNANTQDCNTDWDTIQNKLCIVKYFYLLGKIIQEALSVL